MTTPKDLYYLHFSSLDAFNGNGTWINNGEFSINVQKNARVARGVLGYVVDSVSIPNTSPNINSHNTEMRFLTLDDAGQPNYYVDLTGLSGTFVIKLKDTNTNKTTLFSVPVASIANNHTVATMATALNGLLATQPLAGTGFEAYGTTLADVVEFSFAGPGFLMVISSVVGDVQFSLAETAFTSGVLGFDAGSSNVYKRQQEATQQNFCYVFNVPVGQYTDEELASTIETALNAMPWLVNPIGEKPTITLTQPDIAGVPSDTTWTITDTNALNAAKGFVVYDSKTSSPLANKMGFISSNQKSSIVFPGNALKAEKLTSLSGTRCFYLSGTLAGTVLSLDGQQNAVSTVVSVPVDVPYGGNQVRTFDKDEFSLLYSTPQNFSTLTFVLRNELGEQIDPGSEPVCVSVRLIPWR